MNGDGRRKDGKPFKSGNVREDGSYAVGKNRPPASGQFAPNDGRKRGRRPNAARNFDTDWEEELTKTVQVSLNGKLLRVSAHRAQVMKTLEMGSKGKERSQETIFRKAENIQQRRARVSTRTDDELIAAWLAQQGIDTNGGIVGDDWTSSPGPHEATFPHEGEELDHSGDPS